MPRCFEVAPKCETLPQRKIESCVLNAIETHVQQQLIAKAAKKNHLLPVPKFESLLRFSEHQAPPLVR